MRAAAGALALSLVLVACTSSDKVDAGETRTSTNATAPQANESLMELVDHVTGLTGVAPAGWSQTEYGVHRASADPGEGVFVTWFLPGATGDSGVRVMSAAFGDVPLTYAAEHRGAVFDFKVYDFVSLGGLADGATLTGQAAVATEVEGAYVVAIAAGPDRVEALRGAIFEPALDALGPTGSAEANLPGSSENAMFLDPGAPAAQRAADLLSRMSLREKLGQMTLIEKGSIDPSGVAAYAVGGVLSGGGGAPADNSPSGWADMVDGYQSGALTTRLGIPIIYGVDAVHGHGNLDGATIFPHNIGLGAADDEDLMRRIGRATAVEMAATGIRWNYAPVVAVSEDIRWGRTYETYSSDPQIVTRLGRAYVEGLQLSELADPRSVLGTAKHFIGDGSTTWGSSTTSDYMIDQGVTPVDEALLRDALVPPYQALVDAGVGSVMVSYSSWGDTKMHASPLINDLLKDELGFGGFVVSDWGGIDQIDPDYTTSVTTSVNAGIDMNMVPYDPVAFMWTLGNAVERGDVSMDRVDDAVRRILIAKFEMGLFEQPFADRSLAPAVGSDEHRAISREAVAKSAVLLKNESGVLPIGDDVKSILLVGDAAHDPGVQAGGWTVSWQGSSGPLTGATSIREAIEQRAPEGTRVFYSRTGRLRGDLEGLRADLCIAAVGEKPYAEGVGDDEDLELEGVGFLANLGDSCERSVMVLVTGRPVIVTDYIEDWDALVAAWWFGSEATGLADVLFGDRPFTGRLPVDWPRSADDLPHPTDPLFPRGFGLDG